MIEDLKADSDRWDRERRSQTSRNTSGGIHTTRDATGGLMAQSSNSQAVQYRLSETHQSRQYYGPSDSNHQQDPYGREPAYNAPRYPGTGTQGYNGASHNLPAQQTHAAGGGYQYQQNQQPQHPVAPGYGQAQRNPMMNQDFTAGQDVPYVVTGANQEFAQAQAQAQGMPMSSAPPYQQSTYAQSQPQYGAYGYNQVSSPGPQQSGMQQNEYYGRGMIHLTQVSSCAKI